MADEDVIAPPPPSPDDDDGAPAASKINSDAWLLSFGDLVSLMLVFFVMLFAMSTLEKEEFEAIIAALAQQFNPTAASVQSVPSATLDIPKTNAPEAFSLDYLRALIDDKMAGDPMLRDIRLHQLHDRLVVSLPADPLFGPGSATLADAARDTLGRVTTVIQYLGNRIDIAAHTDPRPVTGSLFPSNWELSLSRAIAVADELRRGGYDKDMIAFGMADAHFSEISLELSVDERYRRARRIDIVVRRDKSSGGGR